MGGHENASAAEDRFHRRAESFAIKLGGPGEPERVREIGIHVARALGIAAEGGPVGGARDGGGAGKNEQHEEQGSYPAHDGRVSGGGGVARWDQERGPEKADVRFSEGNGSGFHGDAGLGHDRAVHSPFRRRSALSRFAVGRRAFLRDLTLGGAATVFGAGFCLRVKGAEAPWRELESDVVICGGGLGGIAAALAACRNGLRVILTEETDWIGGQLTSQGVPPDEHAWIERFGCTRSYRAMRDGLRRFYRDHLPLSEAARAQVFLNPGAGSVSRLCGEPRVAVAVLESMLAPYLGGGRLVVLREHKPVAAECEGDRVKSVEVRNLRNGHQRVLRARWFVDATELGDLLPLAKAEFVTGCEGRAATGELHAPEKADPANQQSFTVCFAIDHVDGQDHTIERPRDYEFWRDHVPALNPAWPGRLLSFDCPDPRTLERRAVGFSPVQDATAGMNLWVYRRIAAARQFTGGVYPGDLSLINWPQNDYMLGNLVGVEEAVAARSVDQAKQLSLSLLYWLQTAAPRPDGKSGWPGLRLRSDVMGTEDGLAKAPYIRESRRIRAMFTIREQDCGRAARASVQGRKESEATAESYPDTVGVGHYPIDLHPTTGGDNYIDFLSVPFQIPLGALLPVRLENLFPACKNIGSTHVTNGGYRLHPVEWNIGESVGSLIAFAARKKEPARSVREKAGMLGEFQDWIRDQGIETHWPRGPW